MEAHIDDMILKSQQEKTTLEIAYAKKYNSCQKHENLH